MAFTDVTEVRSEFEGKTFGRLHVDRVFQEGLRVRLQCTCVCGTEVVVRAFELRSGERKSCGCLKRSVLGDATRTHGRANSCVSGYKDRTYGIWQAMRDRCSNPNRKDYPRYGGRGIKVCRRWAKFENFLADMGEAPDGLTLDRRDNDKGYNPNNCHWATRQHQSYNSTNTVWIKHAGRKKNLKQWLAELQLPAGTYYSRVRRGLTRLQALGLK